MLTELVIDLHHLLYLPKWVHGHLPVCSSNIRFPEDQRRSQIVRLISTENSDGITRVLMPSSLTPDMDSQSIMELIEHELALWSTMSQSLSPGFSMVCMGTTFISGSRLVNGSENLPTFNSFLHCSRRKSCTRSSLGGCCGSQWVMGCPFNVPPD